MQQPTTAVTGGAPPTDPLQALRQQLQSLEEQIEEAQADIDAADGEVQDAEQQRAKAQSQKQELEARKTALQRVVAGLDDGGTKIDQAREAVAEDLQNARTELWDVKEDLEEQLAPEYREAIQGAILAVDGNIAELRGQQADLKDQVAQAYAQVAQAKAAASTAETDLGEAQNAFRGHPGQIKAAGAQVKRMAGDMQAAFDKGQAKEAYLIAHDLGDALTGIEDLTSEAHEQGLVQALYEAWKAVKESKDVVASATEEHEQKKQALAQVDEALKAYSEGRRQKIEEELEKALAALEESSEMPAKIAAY